MKRLLWIVPLAAAGALFWWIVQWKNAPPEVRYTETAIGNLVDTLVTNGKVEPVAYAGVRAPRAGILSKLLIEKGQQISAGAEVAVLDNAELRTQQEAAEARVAQIQAELAAVQSGGRQQDVAEIDGQLARLSLERRQLDTELAAVQRLIAKNAATRQEEITLRDRIAALDQQRKALEARRAVLFTPADRSVLEARLREARAAVAAARDKQALGLLKAPISGIVYQLDPKPGAYLNPGDLVANIGRIDELLVKVFIDEPELGRVAPGMPAVITWDAMPERKWEGRVEKMPVQIVPVGTRQVGEVTVRIANEGRLLPPGANINAAIKSREAARAVIIPKEALRRDNNVQGVFVVNADKVVVYRPVRVGISNVTHAQILEGLREGERVVLPTDLPLRDGQIVTSVKE